MQVLYFVFDGYIFWVFLNLEQSLPTLPQLLIFLYAIDFLISLQLCPTLCDPIDGSPPGSATPGILQAGTLEWVAISFSNAWKWNMKVKSLSRVQLLALGGEKWLSLRDILNAVDQTSW